MQSIFSRPCLFSLFLGDDLAITLVCDGEYKTFSPALLSWSLDQPKSGLVGDGGVVTEYQPLTAGTQLAFEVPSQLQGSHVFSHRNSTATAATGSTFSLSEQESAGHVHNFYSVGDMYQLF